MADNNNSSDEYRCHSCPNKTFKDFYLLLNHFQDQCKSFFSSPLKFLPIILDHTEEESVVGLLCWKKGCNQYFNCLTNLQKHFQEIHSMNEIETKRSLKEKVQQMNILSKSRERLLSIGEDVVLHYLENNSHEDNHHDIHCDLCQKKFSTLSTLKVHYEDIHSIVLSSRAIQHWIFLLQKLHSNNQNEKFKKQSLKKSRSNSFDQDDFNTKRQRTRINDQQLQILRSYFNINNSPTDEQILLMSQKSQLSNKVIKHWFRNTLFKERQRNKDSPYNFANPPSNSNQFDLDEYQKTGTIIKKSDSHHSDLSDNDFTSNDEQDLLSDDDFDDFNQQPTLLPQQIQQQSSSSSSSRRANRTRFSDEQLRLLQDAFESNPYPKDDDLEILSQKLKLNSRVIVVWFQNARQKARKSYENNQSDSSIPIQQIPIKQEKDEGYSCKNCLKLFTRFAELMKHTKQCSIQIQKKPTKKESTIKSEILLGENNSSIDPISSYQMLVAAAAASLTNNQQQQSNTNPYLIQSSSSLNRKENYCEQCDKHFSSLNEFNEHQTLHMQALINAAAFFPLAAYHPAAAAAAAAMAAFSSQFIQTPVCLLLLLLLRSHLFLLCRIY